MRLEPSLKRNAIVHATRRRETIMQKFIAEDSFWELFPHAAVGIIVLSLGGWEIDEPIPI